MCVGGERRRRRERELLADNFCAAAWLPRRPRTLRGECRTTELHTITRPRELVPVPHCAAARARCVCVRTPLRPLRLLCVAVAPLHRLLRLSVRRATRRHSGGTWGRARGSHKLWQHARKRRARRPPGVAQSALPTRRRHDADTVPAVAEPGSERPTATAPLPGGVPPACCSGCHQEHAVSASCGWPVEAACSGCPCGRLLSAASDKRHGSRRGRRRGRRMAGAAAATTRCRTTHHAATTVCRRHCRRPQL